MNIKNSLVVLSSIGLAAGLACSNAAPHRVITGAAGSTSAGAAGDQGAAGNATGLAGDTSGAAGVGAAGDTSGAAGVGAAGDTSGAAGVDASADTGGAAGLGAAGDTSGAAGTTVVMTCMNNTTPSTGNETNCPTKSGWKASAYPVNKGVDGIADNQLLPQYAIDGSQTTRYSSGETPGGGKDALPYYFTIDMGAAKMVSGITVTETAATDTSLGYTVSLSTDGTTFNPVATCLYMAAATEVVSFTPTMARYVRYSDDMPRAALVTSWWSIHEFDISCN